MDIRLKTEKEIEIIAIGGKILAETIREVSKNAKVGVSLKDLDKLAFDFIKKNNSEPAFLGYRPESSKHSYNASICASVNEVIVHGFPTNYILKNGDILKIDIGVKYQGFYSDAAVTIGIGKISKIAELLITATETALEEAIKIVKPTNTLGDIGWIINLIAKKYKFKAVKGLTGHGIGRNLHEDPIIYNFGEKGKGIKLEPGMVLAIEPMFAISTDKVIQRQDESWATEDGSLSAHFEHTIAIVNNGCRILTE
ncbi:MAG: type I methionyl aminopeptidase [Patescibacteria group bacterium]